MVKRYYSKLIIILLLISCYNAKIKYPFNYHISENSYIGFSETFYKNSKYLNNNFPKNLNKPKSGTVSHHLLVAPIINSWFKELKIQNNEIKNFL